MALQDSGLSQEHPMKNFSTIVKQLKKERDQVRAEIVRVECYALRLHWCVQGKIAEKPNQHASDYNLAMTRGLVWVYQPRFRGWGCSQCAWVFNPPSPPIGDSFDTMVENFVTRRDEEFASHVCAEHPRAPSH
jgi:hypothetical protein